MLFKIGSRGDEVKKIQELIGTKADGIFGKETARLVAKWQEEHHLSADGIVGSKTWEAMFPPSTDNAERISETNNGLHIENYPLSKDEYKAGPTEKEYLFLHHTAGWHNPYKVVDDWERDNRGAIATEFVIGGQSIKGNNDDYDGLVLKCFRRKPMPGIWATTAPSICIRILLVLKYAILGGLKTVKPMPALWQVLTSWLL